MQAVDSAVLSLNIKYNVCVYYAMTETLPQFLTTYRTFSDCQPVCFCHIFQGKWNHKQNLYPKQNLTQIDVTAIL